jgi:hypothetical protein
MAQARAYARLDVAGVLLQFAASEVQIRVRVSNLRLTALGLFTRL